MKFVTIAGLLAILVVSVASIECTHAVRSDGNASGPRNIVSMVEFRFRPESLNVFVGDTVTWVNRGTFAHTTTSGVNGKPDGLWIKHLSRGKSFSYVFTQPRTYRYSCMPHHSLGMKGVIVVTGR